VVLGQFLGGRPAALLVAVGDDDVPAGLRHPLGDLPADVPVAAGHDHRFAVESKSVEHGHTRSGYSHDENKISCRRHRRDRSHGGTL
jgi:hypothetical protein